MPGDTLHSEEQRRISNAFRVLITNDTETARHGEISQDYHMHGTVHEGEQFFFSNAYNRGEESLYGIKSAARRFDAGLAPAALDETASKSERKKKRQEHEAAKKRWEDAKRKQARYDAASERLEARILEERVKGAGSENDVLSVPSDYDEVMAADASENAALAEKRAAYRRYETDPRYRLLLRKENRWIGIPLATRSEDEMSRLPEEEKAEVMEADAFYEEMFAGINRARDFMAEGYAATGGRDVESQKIYGRLTRRLAEAANSYALNEREVKARQKIGLAIPDGADPETEAVLMACQAKAEVQRQIRNILREEIRTIVRLIEVARDPDSEALTDGDVRYLSLNGIETDAFREIRDRRERRAAEIAQAREEEAQRRQEAERLRLEEERRAEAQRRAEKEAERKRLLLEAAMEFKGAVDERLAAFSRRASDVRSELTALQKGATREAAETVEQLAALQREIKDFLEADGYAGDLQEALRESVAAAAEKQADVDNAVATSFALYRFRTKEDHRSLADGTTEARVDLLVDAEASEYCDAASSAEFNQMIEDDINGDTELRKVVDGLNSDLQNIRDILDRAKNAADEYDTRISRKERIEYMKKLDAALSDLEKQKAELRLLDVEAGAEAEDRKRDLHRRLFDKRADGYGAAAAAVTENIAALVFAKYERAIRRRTDIERSLPKTADAILTERIARASLSDAEVGELLKRIAEGRVTGEDVNALRENFNVFLTKKYRENEELDAILDKVAAEDGVVLDVDKAALSAAVRYIVTTEKTPDLEGALKTASAETLEELRRDLDALDPEAETGLKINGREAANNIGAKLGALHRIARKNLIASDLAAFEERLNAVSQGHLQGMKDQLAGAYAYTDHPYLDRLLLDAELHSGILRRLGALEPQEQTAILEKIYGDKAGMLAATDELLIGQEDLDDLAIFLKAKLLKAHAGPAGEPDEREMYSMTARHDASRLVRSCRGFLRDVKKKRPDDLALADRMDWLNGLGDKALIEALLRGNAAGSIPGMRFMYLSAYALMLSAEKGERVSAEEIQATEAGKACSADMIKAALTSGLANEEQYGKAADLLRKQASVYDGERLGNRVMNFFGDLIGRDLSRERLGFRALKGLIDAEDQSEARELQMGLARDVLHVKLASGFDPAGIGLLRRIAERTKEGYFFKDDLGHQLALAAGASLYKEKKAKADAARAAAAKRRREEKIEERRRPIDALRTREREARSVYDDRTLENIDGLIAARDAERAGLLAAKRSFAVKGSTDVAFAVLGAQTLFARARKLLSEAAGPNANAREKDLKLEWEELRAAADSIKKNLGSFFNLSTMTKETKDQMNASDTARARAFVALLDKLIGIGDIGKPAQAALQTVLKSAEDLFQAKDGGGLTETAKAALLLDMEDHAIDCDEVLGRMMSGEKAGAANDLATETVSGIAGLTAKSDSVRNALASVNGVQALREARLRRAAAGGGDAGRRAAGSSKLALIVYALHAALNRPIGENWKIYAKTIEKLRANNKEILDRFNLRTMTDDCKDTSDENDTMRRDDFMRRIQDVTRAKDAADCRRAAESLIEYMRDNSMTALADAALIEDAVPLTKGKLDKLTEGIVGSGNLDVKNDMKGTYRKTLKKKMQLTADETDKRTGAQLIKDARLARKDADIEDDEKGMELALTLAAMRKLAVDANSTGATGSDDAWESYKAAFGSLASGLPDVKNLLAITAGGADFLSLPDVKAVNDNFNAFLSFVVNADNRVDFYSGVKDIKDFFERYRILDRTDAVIAADAHLTAAERRRDLTEALGAKGTMSEAKGKVQKSKQNSGIRLLDKVRDEMERDYDRLSAQTGRLKLDAYAGESDAELLFTARGERNTKYGIEGDPKEGATLALNVLGIQTLARHIKDKSTDYAWKPDAAKAAFKKLRLNLQRVFNLEAMTSDAEDLQEGSHVQRLRRDYRALLDAFEDCTTQEEIRKAAEDIYFFALANRLPGRAEAAIAIKDADETFDKKLSKAVCAKTESENNLLQLVRIDLETGYSQTMGKDPLVVTDNPSSLLSADMRENLGAVTKIVVLGVFRTILPPVSFNKFLEALQNPQSEAYALSAERIGIALADAAFEKKGAGGATGKHYRPLAKGEATGVATERSLALARHFINEFSDEIKQLKKPAKQWLKENADTHQSDFSIRQSLLREDLGKEAAAAHKALMVGEMVENLTERVTKDSALHISGHAGGTIGASATVTAVKGNVDLGLTLENDLSIEHGADDRWSVYVGGELQTRIAAGLEADLGPVTLAAGATLNLSGADGMRLDFESVDKCKAFLGYFLTGGRVQAADAPAAQESRDEGDAAMDALKLSSRIVPIRSIAGSITLDASVSLSDAALETATGFAKDLMEMAGISKAATPLMNAGGAAAQRALAFAKSKAGSLTEALLPKIADLSNDIIDGLPDLFDKTASKAKAAGMIDELKAQCNAFIEEGLESKVSDLSAAVGNKITGEVKEKIKDILVAKGGEAEAAEAEASTIEKAFDVAMEKALIASLNAAGAEAEAPDEEEVKWVDVSLAARLSLGGKYETRRPAANMETVTTSVDAGASASASLGLAGASFSKSAEAHFSASLERRFTDSRMTGATMSRRYEIGGDTAAADAKAILASFGLSNTALERDIRGELGERESVRLIVEAEMTREGMERYREAQEEKSTAKSMLILSDRSNYRNTEIRIEETVNSASAERSLNAEAKVSALGEGGAVRLGFSLGAKGEVLHFRRYGTIGRAAAAEGKSA